jgi:hypothetical protein
MEINWYASVNGSERKCKIVSAAVTLIITPTTTDLRDMLDRLIANSKPRVPKRIKIDAV